VVVTLRAARKPFPPYDNKHVPLQRLSLMELVYSGARTRLAAWMQGMHTGCAVERTQCRHQDQLIRSY
jgi:hypothetical protein